MKEHELAVVDGGANGTAPVYKWRDTDPVFLEIHDRFWKEVRARWQPVAEHKALHGFEDLLYDAEGDLKDRRVREDSSFLRALLASIDPEHWGSRTEQDSNITVVIVDVAE